MRKLLISAIVLLLIALLFVGCDTSSPVSLKWRYDTGYDDYRSFVMVDDVIYAPCPNGNFYAIYKSTGKVKWENYDSDGGFTACSVVDGVVYTGRWSYDSSEKDCLYTLDANDGELNWRSELGFFERGNYKRVPTVVDGVVYVGGPRSNLYAIDADSGERKWRFDTEYNLVLSTPSVSDGVVYITTKENLYAIDTNTGDLIWQWKTKEHCGGCSITTNTVNNGMIYVGAFRLREDSSLYAIDAMNGDVKWQYSKTGKISFSPTVVNGEIYSDGWFLFGSKKRYLYALNSDSGELIWKYKMRDRASSSPTVADGVVYVGSEDKNLYAVNANSGELMWKYKTGDAVYSDIIVDDGVIYFGTADGYLYALEIKR